MIYCGQEKNSKNPAIDSVVAEKGRWNISN
jgi:hypothetical protein